MHNRSIPFDCHYDFVLPVYDWVLEYFKDNSNVVVFKRKDFVRFKKQYKHKNTCQFTVVVATDEGDDYEETDQCLLEYICKHNTQIEKLIYVGFDSIALHPKIKKINLEHFLYAYFYNINNIRGFNFDLKEIKKPGATLINRIDGHRLKTFSCYLKNNLPIYISVNDYRKRNPIDYEDFIKNQCYDKDSKHFSGISLDEIMSNVPYKNFIEDNFQYSIFFSFPQELAEHSLFFLVNETYNSAYFTEKSLLPFAFKKIGLWNNLNAVGVLRNMGFDMFDDIVDHSYQYIVDDVERQDILLEEFIRVIDNINSINLDEINTRLEKNQKYLYKDLKDLFIKEQKSVFDDIKREYHRLNSKD